MLVSEFVEVTLNGANIKYYEGLGYEIKRNKNKRGNFTIPRDLKIIVKTKDLSKGSNVIVDVLCDYCLEKGIETKIHRQFSEYIRGRELIQKDCCNNTECMSSKRQEVNMLKYGKPYTSQVDEFSEKRRETNLKRFGENTNLKTKETKDKIKQTNLNNLGVENPMQSKEIQDRAKQTRLEKYGVEHCLQNDDIRTKAVATTLERHGKEYYTQTDEYKIRSVETFRNNYGVDNPSQSEECKQKGKETSKIKYGFDHHMKNTEIKQKAIETMFKNGTQKTSKQQLYIHNIVGGELNYLVSRMFLDIAFPEEMIYCEYDGGFHNGKVLCGIMTQEEFDKQEMKRSCQLSDWGWREIRIISKDDKLPSDEKINEIIQYAKDYLNAGHSWIKFDIDNHKIINNLGKFDYDYEELRYIKDKDLKEVG